MLLAALVAWQFSAAQASVAPTPSMRVTLMEGANCGSICPHWIALQGKIAADTPDLLRRALARMGGARWPILVESPGGAVEAALTMGRLIRERGLTVAVAGSSALPCQAGDRACPIGQPPGALRGRLSWGTAYCASACAFLLASGTTRLVGPHALVGVHQMTERRRFTRVINTFRVMRRMVDGQPVVVSRTLVRTRPVSSRIVVGPAPERLYGEVGTFLSRMGVASALMPLMRGTSSTNIHWMTQGEIAATRIATQIVSDDALAESLWPAPHGPAATATADTPAAPASPVPPAAKPIPWTLGGTATFSLQRPGAPASDLPGTVNWTLLAMPQTVGPPGVPVFNGWLDVPGAGLGLTFSAAASLPYEGGDVAVDWRFYPRDAKTFGEVTALSTPPAWTADGHIVAVAERTVKLQRNEYRVGMSLPIAGEIGPEIRLELDDAAGRHATLHLPVSGPLRALIVAAARRAGRA